MFYYRKLRGNNPEYVFLELENEEAFMPLIEALFPNKEFRFFNTHISNSTLTYELNSGNYWFIPIEVIRK
jgi:hypothetical protein